MLLCPWRSISVGQCWLELELVAAARYKQRVRVLDTLAAWEADKMSDGDDILSLLENWDWEVEWDRLLWGDWFEFSGLVEGWLACVDFPISSTGPGSCIIEMSAHIHQNDHDYRPCSFSHFMQLNTIKYWLKHSLRKYQFLGKDAYTQLASSPGDKANAQQASH